MGEGSARGPVVLPGKHVAWKTSASLNSSGKWGYFMYLTEDKMKYSTRDLCVTDAVLMPLVVFRFLQPTSFLP